MTASSLDVVDLARGLVQRPSEQSAAMEADPAVLGFVGDHVGPLLAGWGLAPRFDGMGNLWV
ncbi:MAG: hypothetical protein ACOCYE_04770, partial [Pseudomonadota bacterium]